MEDKRALEPKSAVRSTEMFFQWTTQLFGCVPIACMCAWKYAKLRSRVVLS